MRFALAILLSAACVCGQGPAPAGLSPRQSAMWAATNSFFDALSHNNIPGALGALSPNISFNLHMNQGFVQIGGSWWGASGDAGFLHYGAAVQKLAPILTDPAHGIVRPIAVDDTTVYVRGERSVDILATGKLLANTTVAAFVHFTPDGSLIQSTDVYYDSAALASASCPSGKLACVTPSTFGTTRQVPSGFSVAQSGAAPAPVAPTSADQANLEVLSQYFAALSNGNTSAATTALSDDVVLTWYGDSDLVPFAGVYYGVAGWTKFFTDAQSLVSSFTLVDFTIPSCVGGACVATWKEFSYTTAAVPRPVDGLVNLAFYTFDSSNKVTTIDVYTDSLEYGIRFCDTFLRCTSA